MFSLAQKKIAHFIFLFSHQNERNITLNMLNTMFGVFQLTELRTKIIRRKVPLVQFLNKVRCQSTGVNKYF